MTVRHDAFEAFQSAFKDLIWRRRAELALGVRREARGLAVVGETGPGKSTALESVVDRMIGDGTVKPGEVASAIVPSPASLKLVGASVLDALGYPLRVNRTGAIIWQRVRDQLQLNGTLVLILDEAQDLMHEQSARERRAVVNTLKSLMQNRAWPVSLVLCGIPRQREAPGVLDLLNHDPQLARRLYPIEFAPIGLGTPSGDVVALVGQYLHRARLAAAPQLFSGDLAERLCHAGGGQLCLLIELVIEAIDFALHDGQPLARGHFAAAYARRTGAVAALNPFLCDDFRRTDPFILLPAVDRRPLREDRT